MPFRSTYVIYIHGSYKLDVNHIVEFPERQRNCVRPFHEGGVN